MDQHYDKRLVTAPAWMERFRCLAGDCPEVCCQQWNVDVDPKHAESLRHIEDPELQKLMDRVLRTAHIRRPGSRHTDTIHRLQLLSQPNRRCPLLNERNECRLQKKYGAYVLCDTCYFHPRTFWQIDEQTYLSACLSCPECARMALMDENPIRFSEFEAEIDPTAEWLETELIRDPETRQLLLERSKLIKSICGLLQNRNLSLPERIIQALDFLEKGEKAVPDEILPAEPFDSVTLMSRFAEIFDPLSEALEKPAQASAAFMHSLAGGSEEYAAVLAGNYRLGRKIWLRFAEKYPRTEENFLVHFVFSDLFKQFYRYQNEDLSATDILRHESALLTAWYWFFRVLFCQVSLKHGTMDADLFLKTASHADKLFWHYPDWFARCADRMSDLTAAELRRVIVSL